MKALSISGEWLLRSRMHTKSENPILSVLTLVISILDKVMQFLAINFNILMNTVHCFGLLFKIILHIHMKLPKMLLTHCNAYTTVHKMNIFSFFPYRRAKGLFFLYLINDLTTDPNITY